MFFLFAFINFLAETVYKLRKSSKSTELAVRAQGIQ